jgi:small subunit ribosomal protein S18
VADYFDNDEETGRDSFRSRRRFYRPRTCQFCTDKSIVINYKDADLLRRFVHEDGKIRARRQTGSCAKHQRKLARAIKRARHIALLPFVGEVLR